MSHSKYGNKPTVTDNVRFDSRAEEARYRDLKLLLIAGEISDLEYRKSHLRYPCSVNGVKICDYEGDFKYKDNRTGLTILEDVKGAKTALYILKRKLVFACYGITITEISVK